MLRTSFLLAVALIASAVTLALAGCGPRDRVILGEADNRTTIAIPAGAEVVVTLPSERSSAFQWVVADNGPTERVEGPIYEEKLDPGRIGLPGTETYVFRAAPQGAGEIRLEYRRPFDTTARAEQVWWVTASIE